MHRCQPHVLCMRPLGIKRSLALAMDPNRAFCHIIMRPDMIKPSNNSTGQHVHPATVLIGELQQHITTGRISDDKRTPGLKGMQAHHHLARQMLRPRSSCTTWAS